MIRAISAWLLVSAFLLESCGRSPSTNLRLTPEPVGRWVTASGNFNVEIAACGSGLCGTVVRVNSDRPMRDRRLEMMPRTTNSMLGKIILSDFRPSGRGEWLGHIYNRDNGKVYDCVMTPVSAEYLKVHPYKILPWFGKTQIWKRVGDSIGLK